MLMTVKELIMEVKFDDLLPYLREIIVGHLDNIYAFREAYDILRDMQPNPKFAGKVWIVQEEDWVSVQSLDGDSWENELAKKLVLSNNATLSKEEIAAHCIYDITFYGFSPAERIENFWKSHGPIQSKMERRESIIQELTVSGSSFTYKDLAYLLQVEYGTRYDYHSIANGQGNRLAYIADSMTKYQQLDLSQYNNAVVCIRVSVQYPLINEELEDFKRNVRSWLNYEDIQFGIITEDSDCKEATVTLLLNKQA